MTVGASHFHSWLGATILVLTTWGVIAADWAIQSERTDTLRTQHIDHENRLRAMESSRSTDEKLDSLTVQITVLSGKIAALESALADARGEVIRITAQRRR